MKIKTLLLPALILALIPIIGCEGRLTLAEREERSKTLTRWAQEDIPKKIRYIRDPRTRLCFAYLVEDVYAGYAPALATVPCDAVQKFLVPSQQTEPDNK